MRIFLGTTTRSVGEETYGSNMYMTSASVIGQTDDGMFEKFVWSCEEVNPATGGVISYDQDSMVSGVPVGLVETATRILPGVRTKVGEIITINLATEIT